MTISYISCCMGKLDYWYSVVENQFCVVFIENKSIQMLIKVKTLTFKPKHPAALLTDKMWRRYAWWGNFLEALCIFEREKASVLHSPWCRPLIQV